MTKLGLTMFEPYFGTPTDGLLAWTDSDIDALLAQAKTARISVPSTTVGIFNCDPALINPSQADKAIDIIQKNHQPVREARRTHHALVHLH